MRLLDGKFEKWIKLQMKVLLWYIQIRLLLQYYLFNLCSTNIQGSQIFGSMNFHDVFEILEIIFIEIAGKNSNI